MLEAENRFTGLPVLAGFQHRLAPRVPQFDLHIVPFCVDLPENRVEILLHLAPEVVQKEDCDDRRTGEERRQIEPFTPAYRYGFAPVDVA